MTDQNDVKKLFYEYTPKYVIHLAAKVGGILDNIHNPANYFDDNVLMNTLMIKYAYLNKVERFIGILSSCIYPDIMEKYPLELEDMHKGAPTITNFSYGYAKRAMAVQIDSYNKQYNTKYNYIMPCNLYGEFDKIDSQKSHFVSALLQKIKNAELNKESNIQLFGDGTPLRQFMHAKDLAYVIKYILDNNIYDNLNMGTPENYSIDQIAKIALNITGNAHMDILYDTTKPNGQYRKDISNDVIKIIPNFKFTKLEDGLKEIYNIWKKEL